MKWALNTYQTCQDWDLDKILQVAKAAGYHGVEFLMDYQQLHGFEWDTPQEKWQSLKDQTAASGLAISSLTSCQRFDSMEDKDRDESLKRVKRVIDMAQFMGCDHVRVLGDRFTDETKGAVVKNVAACLRQLGEYAKPKGVTVSIEMHGSFTQPDPAMEVIESINRPNVGFVFNSQFIGCDAGDIDPLFSRIGVHITLAHTHQAEKAETFELYRQMFQWLKRVNFKGYISNECAYRGADPKKVLAMYVALFRAFAGV